MSNDRPAKPRGLRKLLFGDRGINIRSPAPGRYSSAVCGYWTGLEASNPKTIPDEADPYTQALKQLSASHSPALDDLPLRRPVATGASSPTQSGGMPEQVAQISPAEDTTHQGSDGRPQITGRRYHRLADGGVYVEFVDVSAHEHHGHAPTNKVQPASGIPPFNTISSTNHAQGSGTLGAPDHAATEGSRPSTPPIPPISPARRNAVHNLQQASVAAATAPIGLAQEVREAYGSRWTHPWRISAPADPHGGGGAPELRKGESSNSMRDDEVTRGSRASRTSSEVARR
ncbi:uncharacterized protein THITE_2106528 [Thermothielavioides terrestris NRRL 8126]|uniref:Uncharacterized protein n=1 Tax=Thermothielavioides terrestris (strain ATCC 38088 / NRRL 8126) TaxID=578455 RepID=G2QQJ7_THETT|nr:uncharacterized protein THITE_2106528 [Thermothielavioides terrestris NRRL 8126]AEO62407.1 hypothetical protein THITE_2106528 [Thermothielavioides terrestris NRRL 8126]